LRSNLVYNILKNNKNILAYREYFMTIHKNSLLLLLLTVSTTIIFTSQDHLSRMESAVLTARKIALSTARAELCNVLNKYLEELQNALLITEPSAQLNAYRQNIDTAQTATELREAIETITEDHELQQLEECLSCKQTIQQTKQTTNFSALLCRMHTLLEPLARQEENKAFYKHAHNYQVATQNKALLLLAEASSQKSHSTDYIEALQQLAELDFDEACRQCCNHLETQQVLLKNEAQNRKDLERNLLHNLKAKQTLGLTTRPPLQ